METLFCNVEEVVKDKNDILKSLKTVVNLFNLSHVINVYITFIKNIFHQSLIVYVLEEFYISN